MNKAPWPDFAGRDVHEGDTIRHPSGETGKVVFLAGERDPDDQWRVDYGGPTLSRLCLQVGDKGQAVVVDRPAATPSDKMQDTQIALLAADVARLNAENATLRQKLEEARKDAERLDWLDSVNKQTNERNRTTYCDMNHNRFALSDHNFPALSVREAIDAARQQQGNAP